MIRDNKGKCLLSSLITLLPMAFALFGDLLPEQVTVHWSISGNPDGFANATAFFLVLPPILLAIHWFCLFVTAATKKQASQNKKVLGLLFWVVPAISLILCSCVFATALGHNFDIFKLVLLSMAVLFLFVGNYLPKTTRNVTIGIRIKWTMGNNENWQATHRFGGKVFVAAGLLCLLAIPLPVKVLPYPLFAVLLGCILLPFVYSYCFYKKQLSSGAATEEDYKEEFRKITTANKPVRVISMVTVVILAIGLPILLFTGKIETTFGDTSLTVNATFWSSLTVQYDDIDAVEYREEAVDGSRISGFGSSKLLLGGFQNDEFGNYTRYTYTGDSPCVVLTVGNRTVVIGAESEEDTRQLYQLILSKISQ